MVRFAVWAIAVLMSVTAPVAFSQALAVSPMSGVSRQAGAVAAAAITSAPAAAADGSTGATSAADATMGIAFDVVSIKHMEQGPSRVTNPADGDGITITNSTLREIVRWNYNVGTLNSDQIQGAPEWFSSNDENYEIHAKVAPSNVAAWQKLNDEGRRLIFRKVLVDRFKYAGHFVDVEVPVYKLVVAKGGLKMKEAKPSEVNSGNFKVLGDPSKPYWGYQETRGMEPGGVLAVFQRMDMASFAKWEAFPYTAGRPVIDDTGLTGVYDFTLDFSWQQLSARATPEGAPEPTSPDIFTALQQQLGLKLVSARGLVKHLVVDHIERPSDD